MRNPRSRNLFTYTFTPRTITGCWLSSSGNNIIQLHTYHKKIIDHLELEHLYIFNPTRVTSLVSSWYQATRQIMPVACALVGPSLHEQISPLTTAHPTYNQLPIVHTPNLQWEYTYLYSYDNAHYFYICSFQKSLLFQYQLLSINAQLPLQSITTQGIALLTAYRHLFGPAFRPSQLAMALMRCNKSIEQLFSRDDLARLLITPPNFCITNDDIIPLLVACGLFASEGINP